MRRVALAIAALLAVAVPAGARSSGATFVASTANANSRFAAAADFNTVTVSLADPGTPLHGTVTLAAGAASDRGIASLRFQTAPAGSGTWTDACVAATTPYSCPFDTTGVADGLRDVRVVATDTAGYTRSATVAARRVDNTAPAVALVDPGTAVRGTMTLQSTSSDGAGSGVASVRYQFRTASTGAWTDACTATATPFSCAADTTVAPDGLYDLRAIATDAAGWATTSATLTRRVDNTAPSTATIANPGSPLSGTVTLSGSASDAGSGIAALRFELAPAGSGAWTTACTDTSAPYSSCAWATTGLADALFDLRAVAVDAAGNTLPSSVVANRRVDNNGPTVSLADPGSPLHGSVTLSASAADPAAVASVTTQRKPASGGTWTTICTDTKSPYSCVWDTTGVADGSYDLRATAADALGHTTASTTVAARQVDNTAPTGTDVQVANGSGVAHKMDAGDTLTFSWSETIAPASILAGWDGSATAVTVRVSDAGNADTLAIYDAPNTTRLRITSPAQGLQLQADRAGTGGATFSATAVQSGARVTITLGALLSGTAKTATKASAMLWTPSALASDLAGNAVSSAVVSETSPAGKDF